MIVVEQVSIFFVKRYLVLSPKALTMRCPCKGHASTRGSHGNCFGENKMQLCRLCGKLLVVIALCLCMSSCQAKNISGRVVKVSDGDTFVVLQNKREYKIRLDGVDCPEAKQAYGNKAKQFTSLQIFGKQVKVSYSQKDQYGRYLGKVYYNGGKNLNNELLKAGLAWHYKHYNHDKILAGLETAARKKRVGLWADRHPIPPWEFRRR